MDHPPYQPLAPVQRVILRDCFEEPDAGHHVEQLEIKFSRALDRTRVESAWRATVESCEVLQMAFERVDGSWLERPLPAISQAMEIHSTSPLSWESWLAADLLRPLLIPGQVPWRSAFWPASRRWLWTFHHALLDGRSITRVLRVFLAHLDDQLHENLALSIWHPPSSEEVHTATEVFRRIRRECPPPVWPPDFTSESGSAVRSLGSQFAKSLEIRAAAMEVTAATAVTWAWGQALTDFLGTGAVLVEQIRAGAPQPGTAGFTMHLLPLAIRRGSSETLSHFRNDLLAMRGFEAVSPDDFPADIYPESADAPVIMVEHSTLAHALRSHISLESVTLHERPANFPSATAFLRPDLRMKVEGPHRHALLARWCAVLESPDF